MLDERAGVDLCPRLGPQRHFPARQRANHPEPGLQDHNADCQQMQQAKRPISDPLPPEQVTQVDGREPQHDKEHKQQVQHQDGICQQKQQ